MTAPARVIPGIDKPLSETEKKGKIFFLSD